MNHRLVISAVVVLTVVTGCGSGGPLATPPGGSAPELGTSVPQDSSASTVAADGGDTSAQTSVVDDQPAATAPPGPQPVGSQPVPSASSDRPEDAGDDNGNGWTIFAMTLIALAALAWTTSTWVGHRKDGVDDEASQDLRRRLDSLLTVARWGDSQATQVTLARDPAALSPALAELQTYLVEAEADAANLSGDVDDPNLANALTRLGYQMASLRGSIAAYVTSAAHAATDQAGSVALRSTVDARRLEFERAVSDVIALSNEIR